MRPNWTAYFLAIAGAVAARSDCRRDQVGAVIVDTGNRITGTGYVGTTPGQPGCLDGACPRGLLNRDECPPGSDYANCISFHAEVNALLYSVGRDWHTDGTIYVTRQPCNGCMKLIRASGLANVVYRREDGSIWRERLDPTFPVSCLLKGPDARTGRHRAPQGSGDA